MKKARISAGLSAYRQIQLTIKKVYVCDVCGYEYDGDVPFEQLPDDWTCPLCGVGKDQFSVREE